MAAGKQELGKALKPGEKALVDSISDALHNAEESTELERTAARRGADLLFDVDDDGFISALAITLIPRELKAGSRRIAAVAQPFGFVARISRKERIAVITPTGYVTDFASIPRAVHFLISPFGKHAEAAVIHDWLYTMGERGDRKGRLRADRAFVKALRLLEVDWFKRQIMFWAVRMGGAGGYALPEDFAFRRADDLSPFKPDPGPFTTSFALRPVEKRTRAKPTKADPEPASA
jgi:hypothetical protein